MLFLAARGPDCVIISQGYCHLLPQGLLILQGGVAGRGGMWGGGEWKI